MDQATRREISQFLQARRDIIAENWCRTILQACSIPLGAAQIQPRLLELTDETIDVFLAEALDRERAQKIGHDLAELCAAQPEALGGIQGLLVRQLLEGLSPEQIALVCPRLADLLEGVGIGVARQTYAMVLAEQEEIREALFSDLRASEKALRTARDELELRVRRRTEDLAQINEEFRIEIAERKRTEQMLRENEEKYRALVESINDVIYSVDVDGIVTYVSPSIEPFLGYKQSEIVGRRFEWILDPRDLPRAVQSSKELISGQDQENEFRAITESGEVRWMRTSSRPVFSAKGVVGFRGVVSDITDRKLADEMLREREERLRSILSALHETFVVVYDREIRHLHVWGPPELEQRYGVRIEDMVGKTFAEAFPSIDMRQRTAEIQHVFETGESLRSEFRRDYPNGDFWHDVTYSPLLNSQGEISAVVAFIRDISERVRAEESLRRSEEKWRSLVENAPELVLLIDQEGKVLFINRVPEGSTRSVEQIIGANVADFAAPDYREVVMSAIRSVFQTGESGYHEVSASVPDGSTAWYAMHLGPIRVEDEVESVILLSRNITQRKQIDELKDNLIRDVSHELRTPLAKMQMSLELLIETLSKEEIDGQRALRVGEMVFGNVQRLLRTVEAILDLSSLESGNAIYDKIEILPADLVNEVSLYVRPMVEAKGLELEGLASKDLPSIAGDWEHLFRVLVNLVDNAVKFTESGKVTISAVAHPQAIEFCICDTGRGIQAENLERVFDRFYQERARFDGAGVGLTICKRIVESHGGRIWAESAGRGSGTTIRFTLPALSQ